MRFRLSGFLTRSLLAFAIAFPVLATADISTVHADHKRKKIGAVIVAGVIIGGAIAYNHHKKRKHYKKHRSHARYHAPRYGKHRHIRYHPVKRYHSHHHYQRNFHGYGGFQGQNIR